MHYHHKTFSVKLSKKKGQHYRIHIHKMYGPFFLFLILCTHHSFFFNELATLFALNVFSGNNNFSGGFSTDFCPSFVQSAPELLVNPSTNFIMNCCLLSSGTFFVLDWYKVKLFSNTLLSNVKKSSCSI